MKITLLTGKTFNIETATDLPIKAVRSVRCRRMSLRIDQKEKKAVLNMPQNCSSRRALEFVESNRRWIEEHMRQIPQTKKFEDGEEISLLGEKVVIRHCPNLKSGVVKEGNVLKVSGHGEFLSRRVKDYIYEALHQYMDKLSREKAVQIDCVINHIFIKDTKSRWGSCSTLNNINYSWRIALAPKEVIDYLVAHEVAHLRHRDHSADFWNCVANLSESAEFGRSWLKNNGRLLYTYE